MQNSWLFLELIKIAAGVSLVLTAV